MRLSHSFSANTFCTNIYLLGAIPKNIQFQADNGEAEEQLAERDTVNEVPLGL
jgi:hypothetical protein